MAERGTSERRSRDGVHHEGGPAPVARDRGEQDPGIAPPARHPPRIRKLRRWLLAALVLALLPIGIVNVIQGVMQILRDTDEARRRLYQSALAATEDEQNILAGAEHLLRSLAELPQVRQADSDCSDMLGKTISGLPYFTNVARIGSGGAVMCSAQPTEVSSVADRPWWPEVAQHDDFFLSEQIYRAVSQTRTILSILPIFAVDGTPDGALVLAIDVRWLDALVRGKELPPDTVVALLDRSHHIIAANQHETAQAIFAAIEVPSGEGITTVYDQEGDAWIYAVAPVLGKDVLVAFAMRRADLFGWTYLNVGIHLGLPIVMIALACGVMWYTTHRLVLRWISLLRRIARAYEKGHYQIRPATLADAPLEFRQLGDALYTMAEAVRDRDQRLRAALDYKAGSIREIHHRVKNNLQIVMSLLNLQATRMQEPAASDALAQARLRVSALAVVHSILQDVETADAVDTQRLLDEMARQIHSGLDGDGAHITLTREVAPIMLSVDQATPIALFVVEALSNAYKHAWPAPVLAEGEEGGAPVRKLAQLRLWHDEERIYLTIADNGIGPSETREGSGGKLMKAFARQLNGTVTLESVPDGGTLVLLVFPLRPWPGTPSAPKR